MIIKNKTLDENKRYIFNCPRCTMKSHSDGQVKREFQYIPPLLPRRAGKLRTFRCCTCGHQIRRNINLKLIIV